MQSDEDVVQIPNYIDAIASILAELSNVSDTYIVLLERLVLLLFDNFSKIMPKLVCLLKVLFFSTSFVRTLFGVFSFFLLDA